MISPANGGQAIGKIAALITVNAMVFQEVLSNYEPQVHRLRQTLQAADAISAFADEWEYILTQINYHPIFYVAHQLVIALPSNPAADAGLRSLARTAIQAVQQRAALSHDLMGRVYHRLLADAKYLGTYYTSVPAAVLLLKLALAPDRWNLDWDDLGQLSRFRIGDLACGTGTLLMAAAEAVTSNYTRACGNRHTPPFMKELSRLQMEEIIHGYDVLPSALHLTASTLALRSPDVSFRRMRLYSLPLGGRARRLGSIDFLKDLSVEITTDLFGGTMAPGEVTARGDAREQHISIPDLDLCVMNPPFTRSVGGNLLFGSLPEAERKPMQKELAKLLARPTRPVYASSTAGLGAIFVALGDFNLKPGGRMALVLPKALLSGVAWQPTRRLFSLGYHLEYIIASHDPDRWNFSENTDLSEVLVVARKLDSPNHRNAPPPPDQKVVCLNLWKSPTSVVDALAISYAINRDGAPDIETGQGAQEISMGDTKLGEAVTVPWASIREGLWMGPCAFAQSDLLRAARHLSQGRLFLPGHGAVGNLPFCALGQLGSLGPDARDIHDGFRVVKGKTAYAAFWSHDASLVTAVAQSPNRYLSPLGRAKAGRPLRDVTLLWPKAGRIMLAERLRLNTQRLAAVRLEKEALSNSWWPFKLAEESGEAEKALSLWLNCTIGLLLLLSHRLETEGAWIKFKKPVLEGMPVLDIRALPPAQKQSLSDAYDRLCQSPLLPFPEMAQDPTRAEIDAAIQQALGLPDFTILRELLAQEPVVCLRPLT